MEEMNLFSLILYGHLKIDIMKKLMLLLVLITLISNLSAQKIATKKIKQDPFHFDNLILVQDGEKFNHLVQNGDRSFIISKYKTTNREYLCFLQWTFRMYLSNPEIYKEMLPDTITYPDIFNPEKSNIPVKGISMKQAQAFCQWRSDRLNEYILIREGILKEDFLQFGGNHFNTESYLTNQYEGMVMNDLYDMYTKGVRKVLHSDLILLPNFYIASKEELRICNSLIKVTEMKHNKTIKSDLDWCFLNELENSILYVNYSPMDSYKAKLKGIVLSDMNKIEKFVSKYQKELATQTIDFDTTNLMFSDRDYRIFNLPKYKSQMRYYKLIADSLLNPFKRPSPESENPDKFGNMSYIYIADNYDATPICIYKSAFEDKNDNDISNTGFYCAMNLPYRIYWKLQEFYFIKFPNKFYLY